jgi:hypothetical protein
VNTDTVYVTGYCSAGSHEGTRPKGILTGTPMKVCESWQDCGCPCHGQITKMYEMTGQERVPVPNPEYRPYERDYWMPSDEPSYKMPEAAPDVVDGEAALQITPTGRTRKGGLEAAVQRILLTWMDRPVMERLDGLSVKDIAASVLENEPQLEKEPSLGAIGAVLDRWEQCGYVMLGRKPVRIISLTLDGKNNGLEWCKARFKKERPHE